MIKRIEIIIIAITSILLYLVLSYILRIGLGYLPYLYIWGGFEPIISIKNVSLSIIDIIYLTFGMIVTTHGAINLYLITKENHTAQNMETRKPESIITTGFYAKARHPMYGTFLMIWLGLLIATRSLWGVLVIIIMGIAQYINCSFEEKHELMQIFGDTYKEYMKKVNNRLLLPIYKIYLFIALLSLVGVIFIN